MAIINNIQKAVANTGANRVNMPDYASVRKLIITPLDFSFATTDLAMVAANWETAKKAAKGIRIYPLVAAVTSADKSQDLVVESRPLAGDKPIREGKSGIEMMFDVNVNILKKLRTFNNYAGRVFLGDENNNIYGTSEDGTVFQGFQIQNIWTSNYKNAGDSEAPKAKMDLMLTAPIEQADLGMVIKPTWNVYDLDGLYDVVGTVTNATTTGFKLQLQVEDSGVDIQGLAKADFVLTKAGVATTITTITDNADGTITFAATLTSGTYTLTMVAASAISLTDWAIELKTPITITVS